MDVKPTLLPINPFDSREGKSIYYEFTGYKQTVGSNLVVEDYETSRTIYDFDYTTFEKVHHLPPSILQNGKIYLAKVRAIYDDGGYSDYSNIIKFRTLSKPILDITTIDGQGYVYNKDITFTASYEQSNGEAVKEYMFSLYDENEDLIKRYPIREPDNQRDFSELVKGLEKGKAYFIECKIETRNGFQYSHRERFIPMYVVPSVNGVMSTESDTDEGFIRISAHLKKITGTQVRACGQNCELDEYDGSQSDNDDYDSDNYEYIDKEWVVIPKGKNIIFRDLTMSKASDFITKVWFKNIPNNTKFMEISPEGNKGIAIEFWKLKDRIVARKSYGGVISEYTSNKISLGDNIEFMLFIRAIEHRIDLLIKTVK